MTTKLSPQEWGASLTPPVSPQLVRRWLEQGRIPGAVCRGRSGPPNRRTWEIPADAQRPAPRPAGRPKAPG